MLTYSIGCDYHMAHNRNKINVSKITGYIQINCLFTISDAKSEIDRFMLANIFIHEEY